MNVGQFDFQKNDMLVEPQKGKVRLNRRSSNPTSTMSQSKNRVQHDYKGGVTVDTPNLDWRGFIRLFFGVIAQNNSTRTVYE